MEQVFITTPSGYTLPNPVKKDAYVEGLPARRYKLTPYEQGK